MKKEETWKDGLIDAALFLVFGAIVVFGALCLANILMG